MPQIRPARPDEWPWLLGICQQTAWEQVDPELRPTVNRARVIAWTQQQMLAALQSAGGMALVAEGAAGYLIAAVTHHPLTGEAVGIFLDIWVAPEQRGRGLADALCAAGEAHLRTLGLRQVLRTIAEHNPASLQHALRNGCRVTQHLLSKTL